MLYLPNIVLFDLEGNIMFRKSLAVLAIVLFSGLCVVSIAQRRDSGRIPQYYRNWLNNDVVYIITEDERRFFNDLRNDEERESFIQQFWDRRNPDPRSTYNAFREEHYRRIAYANEHFGSGVPGWRTDRGRVYIIHGPPDERETHATGGNYYRTMREGGGSTTRYPWERWWYRHIEGLGHNQNLLFVDSSFSNEYRLAMHHDELDALLHIDDRGLTLLEEMGLAERMDRDFFNPSATNILDSPFTRMEQYFNIQRPPAIKFNDLKSIVTTHITYNALTFDIRTHFLRLSDDMVIVPISIELNNSELEFRKDKEFNRAKVHVYGVVTGLTNRIHAEWEDEIVRDFHDIYFEQGKQRRSTYQRIIFLPPGQRYKLDLVLRDENSKNVGSETISINVPRFTDPGLLSSTIIQASNIAPAPVNATTLEQYVIGDLRIVPNVRAEYLPGHNLVPYMQIYGMEIDQSTHNPSLEVEFAIKQDGKVLEVIQGNAYNSEQLYYGQRVVLAGRIPVGENRAPGAYQLEIRVLDRISNNRLTTTTDFTITAPPPPVAYVDDEEED